jgi:hypothetical protein
MHKIVFTECGKMHMFPMYLEKLRSLARGWGNTATGGDHISLLCCPIKDALKLLIGKCCIPNASTENFRQKPKPQ